MTAIPFAFTTDTATLCIYDVVCLKHRLMSDADWWCYPPAVQLAELNEGNAAFVDLGSDGRYSGSVDVAPLSTVQISAHLRSPSGRLFIGAGEETSSEGMEPNCDRGGLFLSVPVGVVTIQVARAPDSKLQLAVLSRDGAARNLFTSPLRLT